MLFMVIERFEGNDMLPFYRRVRDDGRGLQSGPGASAGHGCSSGCSTSTFRIAELSLYHVLGKLPEPELAHKFF
jgi:hypothetical protein